MSPVRAARNSRSPLTVLARRGAVPETWAFTSSAGILLVRVTLGLRGSGFEEGSPLSAELEGAVALEAARCGCILEECRLADGRVRVVADVPLNLALTALVSRVKRGAERRIRRRWPTLAAGSVFEKGFLVTSLPADLDP